MQHHAAEEAIGKVRLVAEGRATGSEMTALLGQLGYRLLDDEASPGDIDVVVLLCAGPHLPALPSAATSGSEPAPVVVFGPSEPGEWRKAALEIGAFACISIEAPVEERVSVLAAASRFREMQKELSTVREESNRIITTLLTTYGDEAHQHKDAVEERREAQANLDRIQRRIIRSIL